MGPYFGDLFQQVLYPHRIESHLDLRQRSGKWTWAQSTVPKTQVSRHVESYRMPDLRKFGPQKCRISRLMNWFFIESLQETMFFLPGNIKFSCKLSHHPILGHYELIKKMKKKKTLQPRQRKSLLWISDALGDLTLWVWKALIMGH